MRELERRLPGVPIRTIDDYGVAESAKEALVFALIGFLTVHRLPGVVASCTGAARATVLGSVAPGASPLTLTPDPLAPTHLIVRTPLCGRGRPPGVSELLSIRDLRVGLRRGRDVSEIVRGVDLDVAPGEKLGIVGESGSGKTLTILSILQLLPAPLEILGGSVGFAGEDVRGVSPRRLRQIRGGEVAMVYQDPMSSLNPLLRIGTQIVETLRAHGVDHERARPVPARCSATSASPIPRASRARSPTSSRAACSSA